MTFLYIVTLEHLPIGVIERILSDYVEPNQHVAPRFGNPRVESLAEEWTRRLIGDEPEPLPLLKQRLSIAIIKLREARQCLLDHSEPMGTDSLCAVRLIIDALEHLEKPAPEDSSCDEPTAGT
jgi:hypothetical protein